MSQPNPAPPRPPARNPLPWLVAIAAVIGLVGLAFAWVAGWLTPNRLTPARFTNAIQAGNGEVFRGFRRAHAKGVCVSGYFEASGEGATLSAALVLAKGRTPLVGRMSIGGGTPYGLDAEARVRSMALQLVDDDGNEWRMAMNSFPFFGSASARDFYDQTVAARPDPATGKPDPAKQAAFVGAHPAAQRFDAWAKSAPWSTSWASTAYNGVNTFRFVADGKASDVRWSMRPQAPFLVMTPAQRTAADADYLAEELAARLAKGPVRWDMVVTVAGAGDDSSDPSTPWPDDRRKVNVGTVVIEHSEPQATGACRDLNFDPLILPPGVERSEDSILAARSAVYSTSFNRRQRDIAEGEASVATGKATGKENAR